MRLQVFVDRRRMYVTDVEPGGVSACVKYIKEMVEDRRLVVALDSETQNVTYLIRGGPHENA